MHSSFFLLHNTSHVIFLLLGTQDDRGEAIKVAETVQYFITAMDGVRLEQRAVDELQPMLSDIMSR